MTVVDVILVVAGVYFVAAAIAGARIARRNRDGLGETLVTAAAAPFIFPIALVYWTVVGLIER